MLLKDLLTQLGHGPIQCYAQAPVYTEADKQVLAHEGITVLDDPKGFLELDEQTAVFSVGPQVPVRQITADLTRPAMMVWQQHVNHIGPVEDYDAL